MWAEKKQKKRGIAKTFFCLLITGYMLPIKSNQKVFKREAKYTMSYMYFKAV